MLHGTLEWGGESGGGDSQTWVGGGGGGVESLGSRLRASCHGAESREVPGPSCLRGSLCALHEKEECAFVTIWGLYKREGTETLRGAGLQMYFYVAVVKSCYTSDRSGLS